MSMFHNVSTASLDDGTTVPKSQIPNAVARGPWLTVIVAGFEVRVCKLCDDKSTDTSPLNVRIVLEDSTADGQKGASIGHRPNARWDGMLDLFERIQSIGCMS